MPGTDGKNAVHPMQPRIQPLQRMFLPKLHAWGETTRLLLRPDPGCWAIWLAAYRELVLYIAASAVNPGIFIFQSPNRLWGEDFPAICFLHISAGSWPNDIWPISGYPCDSAPWITLSLDTCSLCSCFIAKLRLRAQPHRIPARKTYYRGYQ